MDNEQFNTRFYVRTNNSQEMYYILTPHMMEYITAMADKSDGTVYIPPLQSGELHIAIRTGRDFFEFGKSSTGVGELRQEFLDKLCWFTGIVNTLRVEDTLYKKKTNV